MLDQITMVSANEAIVKSQNSDKQYKVNISLKTCECPDFIFRNVQCKHIRAVSLGQVQEKMINEFSESNLVRDDLLLEWGN